VLQAVRERVIGGIVIGNNVLITPNSGHRAGRAQSANIGRSIAGNFRDASSCQKNQQTHSGFVMKRIMSERLRAHRVKRK
jgi:hypothetical protein